MTSRPTNEDACRLLQTLPKLEANTPLLSEENSNECEVEDRDEVGVFLETSTLNPNAKPFTLGELTHSMANTRKAETGSIENAEKEQIPRREDSGDKEEV